jgi:hypothetical protein
VLFSLNTAEGSYTPAQNIVDVVLGNVVFIVASQPKQLDDLVRLE